MHLLIFVLNKEEHLEEILEAFLELGIPGATIIDSVGMGRILAHDIPIFAGFRGLMQDSRAGNKTILSVILEEKIPLIIKAIEQICGSLDDRGNGIMITIPIGKIYGYSKKG
jgi:nitrogen regulatory protein P-II 1